MIYADVAGEDRIVRQDRLAVGDDAFRPDRGGMNFEVRFDERVPTLLPFSDVLVPGRHGLARRGTPFDLSKQLAQEGSGVGENAYCSSAFLRFESYQAASSSL